MTSQQAADLEIKAHHTLGYLSAAITQAIRQLERPVLRDADPSDYISAYTRAQALTVLRDADARYADYHAACRKALAGLGKDLAAPTQVVHMTDAARAIWENADAGP